MLNKKDRTMEKYVKAGASIRLLNDVYCNALVEVSKILPAKDMRLLEAFQTKLWIATSRCEEQMYSDYPDLGHEGTAVFYGDLGFKRHTKIDDQVLAEAKEQVKEMFQRVD